MNDEPDHKHSLWMGIWKQAMSFLIGVIVAAFFVGSRTQRIKDIQTWKDHISPKIERMDSVGSLSFDHWKVTYEKEQKHNEDRLKTLEVDVKELQKKIDP